MYTTAYDQALTLADGRRVKVRCLQEGDAPRLARLFEGLSAASRDHFRPHPFTAAGAAEVVRAAADPGGVYFFLLVEDEPAGYGFLTQLQRPDPTLGIAVVDRWQNRGLGKALMRFLVGVADRLGKEAVNLTVDDDNPRAIHVYEETGFRLIRKVRVMRLTLRQPDDSQ